MRAMPSLENRMCWNGNHKTALEISSCPSSPFPSSSHRRSPIRRVLCVLSRYRRWKHGNQTSGFGFCFYLILISCLRRLGLTFNVLHRYTLICVCGFFCVSSLLLTSLLLHVPIDVRHEELDVILGWSACSVLSVRFVMYCLHLGCFG